QVSWLTSLLHADILSSRFDQQANQSWKLDQAGVEPTLEDPECFFGNLCLAQLAPPLLSSLPGCFVGAAPDWMFHHEHLVTKIDQVLMSCDNVLEEEHKTKHAGLAPAPFSFGVLGSTGCRSLTQGPAAKSQVIYSRREAAGRARRPVQLRQQADAGPWSRPVFLHYKPNSQLSSLFLMCTSKHAPDGRDVLVPVGATAAAAGVASCPVRFGTPGLPPPSQAGWCTACDWMFHQGHSVTKMDQVLMSCDNFLEEKHKTEHAGPCVEERQPVDPKMPSEKTPTATPAPALQRKKENSNNYKIQDNKQFSKDCH
ncbi:Glycerol uptake facilitator protein 4, partial [Frankliniella fusca]